MTTNRMIQSIVFVLVVVALTACRKEKQADIANASELADPLAMESELRILALEGRIESAKNSIAFDWVTPFEKATGCKVKATMLESNELLAANLAGGKYDLIIVADSFLPSNAFQTIDYSRIRSFKNLDRRFLEDPAVQRKSALPLHWKLVTPTPPSTELITEVESTHLLANAKNINCAYAWMEWTLSPKVQADIAAALDTIPVVPAACVGNELLGDDACKQRMAGSP